MSSWGDGDNPWPVKDSDSADGEVEAGELGHICEVRDAFAEFDKSGDFVEWLDDMPYGEEEDPVRKAKRIRDTYAIVCGHYPTRESTWEVQTIWINNPILQDVLRVILGDHPDWSFRKGTVSFQKPFVPLVHHWEQLCEVVDIDAGSEAQKFMKLFMDLIRGELRDTLIRVKQIMKTGCAASSDLQFVYKPGQLFFDSRPPMAAGISRDYIHSEVIVSQVVWNGEEYRATVSRFEFPRFAGIRSISELSVRPAWAYSEDDIKNMEAALVERGRKYEALRGIHYRFYPGILKKEHTHCEVEASGWGDTSIPSIPSLPTQAIAGRVIVDAAGQHGHRGSSSDSLSSLRITSAMYRNGQYYKASTAGDHQESQEDSHWEDEEDDGTKRLRDEQAMLTVSTVHCFSIEYKMWCTAKMDDLKDIEWNTQAFDNLVIDEAEKRLLVGFIGATNNGKLQHFDDFVHGKGKGLVMLLCGPPGTGKTFTAESVSENLKRPLYRVDTSDLGMDPKTLESNLKTALDRCARWDAILLLDEADVFLEKRTSSNLTQNEMTTSRLLSGVMMLTTNRYLAIDPAFESRIDLSFVFQDLEPASRAKVWYNFLIREDKALAGDSDAIAKLASMPLNGRQIKSAVKTARILAASENLPLAVDHLQTVVFMRMKALKMLE
ncbi:uncharacterized protein FPRO_09219 [Fusarium proliferatum ET1]|uniref:Related to TOB3 (Member of AAA-ATPase family) n=1 Tax=Fusarium proliferatum (strain ET1) TaxID=1227346 RepID=A0A1L7VN27_FUSPR|nr:uncharacterized protein FPRO_09219 [Fusarium proliferatum ET1]CZR41918.1 related to TOB3 (member of AAA-ATPase family) [Fusarium proliferatum ET1]